MPKKTFFSSKRSLIELSIVLLLGIAILGIALKLNSIANNTQSHINTGQQPTSEANNNDSQLYSDKAESLYLPIIRNGNTQEPINIDEVTTNWQYLENSAFNYSIKYPSDFSYINFDASNNFEESSEYAHAIGFYPNKYLDTFQSPEIGLVIYKNPQKLSLDEWFSTWRHRYVNEVNGSSLNVIDEIKAVQHITINQKDAISYIDESSPRSSAVLFHKGSQVIKLYYTNANIKDEDLAPTFDLMLKTLQFEP